MYSYSSAILISICIPTFNRGIFLERTIESIISQKIFNEDLTFELIVCNNASSDNTEEICLNFIKKGVKNFIYIKNDLHLSAALNHKKILNLASGVFLKLNSDCQLFSENSLLILKREVLANLKDKPLLFFSNGELNKSYYGVGIQQFIQICSYKITNISNCGFWKSDTDFYKDVEEFDQLPQVSEILKYLYKKEKFYVNNEIIYKKLKLNTKSGYDLISVFLDLYFAKLNEYVKKYKISNEVIKSEEKKMILNFISPWVARIIVYNDIYKFQIDNYRKRIFSYLKYRPFLYFLFFFKCQFLIIYYKLHLFSQSISKTHRILY